MAMIDCPECGHPVSDAAASCPSCGHPIGNATDAVRSERTVTTQETGKEAKINQAIGGVAIVVGVVMLGAGSTAGGFVMLAGVIWWGWFRLWGWWHYG